MHPSVVDLDSLGSECPAARLEATLTGPAVPGHQTALTEAHRSYKTSRPGEPSNRIWGNSSNQISSQNVEPTVLTDAFARSIKR